MRRCVCFIVFMLLQLLLLAQPNSSQVSDTALVIPIHLLKNTSHQHYLDVLEFSKKGDSINASASFAKIDPLYLLYLGHDHTTAESIDTFFSELLLRLHPIPLIQHGPFCRRSIYRMV